MTNREKFLEYLKSEKKYIKQKMTKEIEKSTTVTSKKKINARLCIKQNCITLNDRLKELAKEYSDIEYLIKVMGTGENEWKNANSINNITGILSKHIEKTPSLHLKEKLDLLMGEIKRNIENGACNLEQAIIVDPTIVESVGLTFDEIESFMKNLSISDILKKKNKELTSEEQKFKQVVEEGIDTISSEQLESITTGYKLIEKHYFSKDNDEECNYKKILTKDDIEKTIEGLKKIGITESFRNSIKFLLEKEQIKQPVKQSIVLSKIQKKEQQHFITDKEYKQIKKEILNYFNPYTGEVKGNPTEEEVLYCAQLMLKIETEKDIVRTFFRKTEKNLENAITEMLRNEEKINYYRDKVMVEEELNTMNDSFKEIFITTPEDYVFWKDTINQSLQIIKGKLPKMYEYELNKAATTDIKQKTLKK